MDVVSGQDCENEGYCVYTCLCRAGSRLRGAAPAVGRGLNGALVGSDVNSYAQSGETKTEYRVCVCSCMDLNEHVLWFTLCAHISEKVQFSVWVYVYA